MKKLTAEQENSITTFGRMCFDALIRADDAVMRGDSTAADAERAIASYWSGRAFGEVLK